MLQKLIEFCLANRFLVIACTILMAVAGVRSAMVLPIDAVPDMTNVQVTVITEAGSLSPVEVEQYITYPVESTMGGLPNVEEVRSVSKFGISVVTIVFGEGTDIYFARQVVAERLLRVDRRHSARLRHSRTRSVDHRTGGDSAVRGPRRRLHADATADDVGMGNRAENARGCRSHRDQYPRRILQDL